MGIVARASGGLRYEYGLEGHDHIAVRSGCAIGITVLKMALSENRTETELSPASFRFCFASEKVLTR